MSTLVNVGINIATDLVIGLVIKAGTGGDKTKEAARATEVEAIATAFQKLATGDVPGGLAALQAALNTTHLAPAEAFAVQNFVNFASTQGAALAQLAGNTIVGQAVETIVNNLTTELIKVCNGYIAAAPVAPAA